jgi:hypothetical protein
MGHVRIVSCELVVLTREVTGLYLLELFLLLLWLLHCVQIPFLHCAKTQVFQVIDRLLVLLIALAVLTLLTFVCRRLTKDLSIGRIGCTQLLCQFPRHGDSGVSFF